MGLTPFQAEVAQEFFALPESAGYLLAGGSALLALDLITRPTQDVDFFTAAQSVIPARNALLEAIGTRKAWTLSIIHDSATFCRIEIRDDADRALLVDLAVDSPPVDAPTMTVVGPTPVPIELSGRKLLALFGRAEARDFSDVFVLASKYGKAALIAKAREIDAGFDTAVLAQMLDALQRFSDSDIPIDDQHVSELRAFFAQWATELRRDASGSG